MSRWSWIPWRVTCRGVLNPAFISFTVAIYTQCEWLQGAMLRLNCRMPSRLRSARITTPTPTGPQKNIQPPTGPNNSWSYTERMWRRTKGTQLMLSDTPPPNSALIAYATEEALCVCTHLSAEIAPKFQLPEWPGVDIRSVERQASGEYRVALSRGVQAANVTHGWSQVVTTWDCKAPYSIDFRLYYRKRTKVPLTTIKYKAHLHIYMYTCQVLLLSTKPIYTYTCQVLLLSTKPICTYTCQVLLLSTKPICTYTCQVLLLSTKPIYTYTQVTDLQAAGEACKAIIWPVWVLKERSFENKDYLTNASKQIS